MNRPNPIARVQGRAPVPQSPSRPYQRVVAQQNQYTTHRPPATQFQQLASPSSQNESPYPSQQNYQQFETSESFEESQPMSQLPRVQRASTDLPSRDVVDRYRQNPLSSANRLRTEGHPSSPAPGPPGGSRANVKASEVLLAKIAELEGRFEENKESILSLRDMLHDMRNSMKAIPTRQEVKEDLVEQRKNLSPIWLTAGTSTVAEMEKSASERMDSSRVPQDTANLMLEKVRPLLNVGASQTTVKQLATLMDHLVASLRPVDELKTTILKVGGIPEIMKATLKLLQAVDLLRSRVDNLAGEVKAVESAAAAPRTDERVLNLLASLEKRLDSLDKRFDNLATDTTAQVIRKDVEELRLRPQPPTPAPIDIPALAAALNDLISEKDEKITEKATSMCLEAMSKLESSFNTQAQSSNSAPTPASSCSCQSKCTPVCTPPSSSSPPVPKAAPTPSMPPRAQNGRFLKRRAGQSPLVHQDSLLQVVASGHITRPNTPRDTELVPPTQQAATTAAQPKSNTKSKRKSEASRVAGAKKRKTASAPQQAAPAQAPQSIQTATNTPSAQHDHQTTSVDPNFVRRSERRRSEPRRFTFTDVPGAASPESSSTNTTSDNNSDEVQTPEASVVFAATPANGQVTVSSRSQEDDDGEEARGAAGILLALSQPSSSSTNSCPTSSQRISGHFAMQAHPSWYSNHEYTPLPSQASRACDSMPASSK